MPGQMPTLKGAAKLGALERRESQSCRFCFAGCSISVLLEKGGDVGPAFSVVLIWVTIYLTHLTSAPHVNGYSRKANFLVDPGRNKVIVNTLNHEAHAEAHAATYNSR